MTTWTVFCAGGLTVLVLLTLLICAYALIVSNTTSQDHEEQEKHEP